MLRSLLERSTHGLKIRRHLPRDYGGRAFYASTEGGLKMLKPDLSAADPVLLSMAKTLVHPGDTVWDIGANVGLFSFAASGLAGVKGKVFAIEPDLWLVDLLRRSASLPELGTAPVVVLPVAVAAEAMVAHLRIARRARASNFLMGHGASQCGGVREECMTVTVTLDWLVEQIPGPNVLKIDTEGAELDVLQGAHHLLNDCAPTIFCEVSKDNAQAVTKLLFDHKYEIFDATKPDEPVDVAPWNTLAIPV